MAICKKTVTVSALLLINCWFTNWDCLQYIFRGMHSSQAIDIICSEIPLIADRAVINLNNSFDCNRSDHLNGLEVVCRVRRTLVIHERTKQNRKRFVLINVRTYLDALHSCTTSSISWLTLCGARPIFRVSIYFVARMRCLCSREIERNVIWHQTDWHAETNWKWKHEFNALIHSILWDVLDSNVYIVDTTYRLNTQLTSHSLHKQTS